MSDFHSLNQVFSSMRPSTSKQSRGVPECSPLTEAMLPHGDQNASKKNTISKKTLRKSSPSQEHRARYISEPSKGVVITTTRIVADRLGVKGAMAKAFRHRDIFCEFDYSLFNNNKPSDYVCQFIQRLLQQTANVIITQLRATHPWLLTTYREDQIQARKLVRRYSAKQISADICSNINSLFQHKETQMLMHTLIKSLTPAIIFDQTDLRRIATNQRVTWQLPVILKHLTKQQMYEALELLEAHLTVFKDHAQTQLYQNTKLYSTTASPRSFWKSCKATAKPNVHKTQKALDKIKEYCESLSSHLQKFQQTVQTTIIRTAPRTRKGPSNHPAFLSDILESLA